MNTRDLLLEIAERGITLRCGRTEDRLNAKPTAALTPELIAEIKQHKAEIIEILREDQRKREDQAAKETKQARSERRTLRLLPKSGAAGWDEEWARRLLEGAHDRFKEHFRGLSQEGIEALDLSALGGWEERIDAAWLTNNSIVFWRAVVGWERAA